MTTPRGGEDKPGPLLSGVRCRLSSGRWAAGALGNWAGGVGTTSKLCFCFLHLGASARSPLLGVGTHVCREWCSRAAGQPG